MGNEAKKIVKLAIIRDNRDHVCPFGLPIPGACMRAGECVNFMQPVIRVDNESDGDDVLIIKDPRSLQQIIKTNKQVLIWNNAEPQQCIYANALFDNKAKVECNFGDAGAGLGHANFIGMPSYTQYFSAGYSSVPIGFYSEHPSRNQVGNLEALVSGSFASNENDDKKIKKT